MFDKKFIGWSALALFVVAAAILALQVLLIRFLPLNLQAVLLASGVFALAAVILGFYAFTTSPGKVGAIGGLVMFSAVVVLLSVTTITRIERSGAQPLPVASVAMPGPAPSFTGDKADGGLQRRTRRRVGAAQLDDDCRGHT